MPRRSGRQKPAARSKPSGKTAPGRGPSGKPATSRALTGCGATGCKPSGKLDSGKPVLRDSVHSKPPSPPPCPEIIIAGPPNSGKTSLFNHLTGRKNKTVNYPGSTAFVSTGFIQEKYDLKASLIDTPGAYSLFSQSEEGETARALLRSSKNRFACALLVIDAVRLEARLPLLFQLKEIGLPVVLILSFYDKIQSFSPSRLSRLLKVPVIPMKGLIGDGVPFVIEELKKILQAPPPRPLLLGKPWTAARTARALRKAQKIASASKIHHSSSDDNLFLSDKYDRFFLHPVTGPLALAASMFALFASLFWLAAPFMSLIDGAFGALVSALSGRVGAPGFLLRDFLGRGVAGSFGAVLVFTPQIFILFFGIRLLEDSGYLARAVTTVDSLFSRFGLSGRAFVPFLSGYACAVPAALAVRSLPSKRERRIALFALPFMSCSARLPVYTLLLGLIFYGEAAWKPALSLSLIYFGSLVLGLLAALVLHRILPKERRPPFILDLPLYQRPSLSAAFRNGFLQTRHYFTKAGPAVFLTALLIWTGTRFPLPSSASAEGQTAQQQHEAPSSGGGSAAPLASPAGFVAAEARPNLPQGPAGSGDFLTDRITRDRISTKRAVSNQISADRPEGSRLAGSGRTAATVPTDRRSARADRFAADRILPEAGSAGNAAEARAATDGVGDNLAGAEAGLSFESERTANSYAGRLGRFLEPVFEVMGIDWRTGTALIAAFAAREVFVSSLTLLFHESDERSGAAERAEESLIGSAVRKMRQAKNSKGEPAFTAASLVALILFFMFSLQCLSTTAVTAREQGTGFALLQLIVLNGAACITAAAAFQILSQDP